MAAVSVYTYEKLSDSRNIRLLRITPSLEDDSPQKICCQLEEHSLDSGPVFHALSYTWGKAFIWSTECDDLPTTTSEQPGNATPTIFCKSQDPESGTTSGYLTITQSLFDALSHFVDENWQDLLWIDAISINQNDIPERNSQVELMGDIYTSAVQVIIWLGNDEKHLKGFHWLHNEFVLHDGIRKLSRENADDPAFLATIGVSTIEEWFSYMDDYREFFQCCQWFHRAWILQEVTLAREIIVLLGKSAMSWETMYEVACSLTSSGANNKFSIDPSAEDLRPLGWQMNRLGRIRDIFHEGGPEALSYKGLLTYMFDAHNWERRWFAYFGMLLSRLRRSKATDSRDKVYSLLGIWSMTSPQRRLCKYLDVWLSMVGKSLDSTAYVQARSLGIKPSYEKENTVAQVYTSATALVLEGTQHLAMLSFVEDRARRRIVDLPSWVPDYTFDNSAVPLTHRIVPSASYYSCSPSPVYNAALTSTGSQAQTCIVKVSTLYVQGASFDTIQEEIIPLVFGDGESFLPLLFGIFQLCLSLDAVYQPTGQPREEVLWRTWIADSDGLSYPAPESIMKSFHDTLALWLGTAVNVSVSSQSESIRASLKSIWIALQELRATSQHNVFPSEVVIFTTWELLTNAAASRYLSSSVDEAYTAHKLSLGDFRKFDQLHGKTSADRSLFRTSKGYLGLGPRSMRAGDEVFLLRGSHVPFVLRKNEDKPTYSLVGESYLHGFMNGEILTEEFQAKIGEVAIE